MAGDGCRIFSERVETCLAVEKYPPAAVSLQNASVGITVGGGCRDWVALGVCVASAGVDNCSSVGEWLKNWPD